VVGPRVVMVEVMINGLRHLQALATPSASGPRADQRGTSEGLSRAWLGEYDARTSDELWAEIYPLMCLYSKNPAAI
jgi:hypothetical protein